MRTPFPRVKGIAITEDTCFGAPRIDGTRMPVENVIDSLWAGDSESDVMEGYSLNREQMKAVYGFMRACLFRVWADNARAGMVRS